MSLLTDALATNTVRTAIVGGVPAPRPVQEPPQDTRPVTGGAVRPRVPAPSERPAACLVVPDRIVVRLLSPETELERRAAWGDR